MAEFDAVVAGYAGVDLAPEFPLGLAELPLAQLLRPGSLTEVGPLEITPGGVVPNTGLAMNRFGCRVALQGLVGQDALGDILLGLLDGHGATVNLRRTSAAGTAYGVVIAPPGTDRAFLEYPGCNAIFTASDVDFDLVAQSRLFHFGYPPLMPAMLADDGAELVSMFRQVRALGVTTSLDMTLPDPQGASAGVDWRRLLTNVLPHVSIFVPSLEELLAMLAPEEWGRVAGADDPVEAIPAALTEQLAEDAMAMGAAIVLIKAGCRGGLLCTAAAPEIAAATSLVEPAVWASQKVWVEPWPVDETKMVNACGAGDAAVAGFLTAVLNREKPAQAASLAMLAGRDSLYGVDTTSGLRDWETMRGDAIAMNENDGTG